MTVGTETSRSLQKRRELALTAAFPQGVRCQNCLQMGHWSYECTNRKVFAHRPSRTQMLQKKLKIQQTLKREISTTEGKKSAVPKKRNKMSSASKDTSDSSSSSSSSSDSDSSDSSSDSSSSSSGSESDSSSSSDVDSD